MTQKSMKKGGLKGDLEAELETYLARLRAKRLQPSTLRIYERELKILIGLIQRTSPHAIQEELEMYLEKRSDSTHLRLTVIWKSFLKTLGEGGRILAENLSTPKLRNKQPVFLDEKESFLLEANCYKGKQISRDRLFVAFALQLGLRLSEILNLKFSDIEDKWVRIVRKGGKEQRLPLRPSLKALVQFWKTESFSEQEDWVFPGRNGKPMTSRAAQLLLKRICARAQMTGKKVTPHSLRHTFASTLAARGASLAALKELLGHEKITTTERYLHVTPQHLQETLTLLDKKIEPVL